MSRDSQVRDAGVLWTLLTDMRIEDPGAPRSFEQALAEATGWSEEYARAVAQEYRRFLYLAATSDERVTPSIAVDEAWHLHLTYSRHYWDVLCKDILGRPLHHEPSAGGRAEDIRHAEQYETTLRRYEATFLEPPPRSIWPRPDAEAEPDRAGAPWTTVQLGLAATALGLVVAAASAPMVVGIILVCAAVAVAFAALFPRPARARDRGSCSGGGYCGGGGDGCAGCGSGCGGGCGGD